MKKLYVDISSFTEKKCEGEILLINHPLNEVPKILKRYKLKITESKNGNNRKG